MRYPIRRVPAGAMRTLAVAGCILLLGACGSERTPSKPHESADRKSPIVEVRWTHAALEAEARLNSAMFAKGSVGTALPRLRAYDSMNRLIYVLDPTKPWSPDTVGNQIDAAAKRGVEIAGPSFEQTVGEFELRDGKPAATVIKGGNGLTVFDYWADWCVPCKELEKGLRKWVAAKPKGSVQLVHAEADPTKLAKERREKVYKLVKGKDGKLVKVEM